MENLQSCPCCLSEVEIVCVNRNNNPKVCFLIQCNHCGKGTAGPYPTKIILAATWNSMVLENKHTNR